MFLRISLALLMLALPFGQAGADQTTIEDYRTAREQVFYRLYVKVPASESTDIYCGLKFWVDPEIAEFPEGKRTGNPAPWLTLEHAYPAKWMAEALDCGNRTTCPKDDNPTTRARFNHAEADLHNLWPAVQNLNSSRGDRLLGELKDKSKRTIKPKGQSKTFECDYQQQGNIVQPRRIVRGNLARSIFYMCDEYGFPVDPAMLMVLKKWNKQDRPTKAERTRNERIAKLQGTRNRFIDAPDAADGLRCSVP